MASVSFKDIEKSFGSTKVIHGISFDIKDGEFMVLVGPSGCGKSTLLRMLAGLEEISGGTIAIDTKVVNDVESKDRDIAMVFQSYAAASGNGSRWVVPSCAIPRFSCSTSPCRTSMPSCGSPCAPRSRRCTSA